MDKREKTKGERENHRRGVGKEGNKKEIRGVEKWRQQGRGEGKIRRKEEDAARSQGHPQGQLSG